MSIRAGLAAGLAALATLSAAATTIANADEGPLRTVLRPVDVGAEVGRRPASATPKRELIIFVGGIGSRSSDTTFDDLMLR